MELKFVLESLLFSAQKPLSARELKDVLAKAAQHAGGDEAVKAFVVLESGEVLTAREIEDFCRQRLAPFKIPSVIEFVEALPMTSLGKIEKRVLREQPDTA